MSWQWGNKSSRILTELDRDLVMILDWGLQYSPVDFGLNEGHRPPAKQLEYFKKGRKVLDDGRTWIKVGNTITNCDGYKIRSKHNYSPSDAVDIYIHVLGKPSLSYDLSHLSFVAGILIAASEFLFEQGKITHKLRWGGNWDKDGEILFDQEFDDTPHLELYIP